MGRRSHMHEGSLDAAVHPLIHIGIQLSETVFLPDLFQRFLVPGAQMPLHRIPHFRHDRQIGFLRDVSDSDDANFHARSSPFTVFRSSNKSCLRLPSGACQHFFDRFHDQSVVLQMIQTGNADGTSHFPFSMIGKPPPQMAYSSLLSHSLYSGTSSIKRKV